MPSRPSRCPLIVKLLRYRQRLLSVVQRLAILTLSSDRLANVLQGQSLGPTVAQLASNQQRLSIRFAGLRELVQAR